MIIISTVRKSGVPTDALVVPEGYGMPQLSTMSTQSYSWQTVPFQIVGKPNSADSAFAGLNGLTEHPDVDWSQCTSFQKMTDSCYALEKIDLSSANPENLSTTAWRNGFGACGVKEIVNMPVKESETSTNAYYLTFSGCQYLEKISFNGKIGASVDFHYCNLNSQDGLLPIAWALSETNVATVTFKSGNISTIMSNAHVKVNEAGNGLEFCNVGDEGDLGSLGSYITGKGWTIAYQ